MWFHNSKKPIPSGVARRIGWEAQPSEEWIALRSCKSRCGIICAKACHEAPMRKFERENASVEINCLLAIWSFFVQAAGLFMWAFT